MDDPARPYAPSALPSVTARLLAFLAILLGGLCGGLIGWSVSDLQCTGDCTTWNGAGAVIGATAGAGGVGIVAVLVLRAMAEWRRELEVDDAGIDLGD